MKKSKEWHLGIIQPIINIIIGCINLVLIIVLIGTNYNIFAMGINLMIIINAIVGMIVSSHNIKIHKAKLENLYNMIDNLEVQNDISQTF